MFVEDISSRDTLYSHIVHKVSLTCVFDERQFDCGTTFLSTANPALVVGDKVNLQMIMISGAVTDLLLKWTIFCFNWFFLMAKVHLEMVWVLT